MKYMDESGGIVLCLRSYFNFTTRLRTVCWKLDVRNDRHQHYKHRVHPPSIARKSRCLTFKVNSRCSVLRTAGWSVRENSFGKWSKSSFILVSGIAEDSKEYLQLGDLLCSFVSMRLKLARSFRKITSRVLNKRIAHGYVQW